MKVITPLGSMILVEPLPKENEQSDGGVIMVENTLTKGKVVEVGSEYSDVYKKGDIVIFPENAGIHQYYKQKNCTWLNGQGFPTGQIIGIVSEEK